MCSADGRMAGGSCVAATCAEPVFPRGWLAVYGCTPGGHHGADCMITCANGYLVSGGRRGYCLPDAGVQPGTASYQQMQLTCGISQCDAPPLLDGEVVLDGCVALGTFGCKYGIGLSECQDSVGDRWDYGLPCEIGCTEGYIQAVEVQEARGTCLPDDGVTAERASGIVRDFWLSSYQGQMAHCVDSPIAETGGWTWLHGASSAGTQLSTSPVLRSGNSVWRNAQTVWSFGGLTGSDEIMNDMWSLRRGVWTVDTQGPADPVNRRDTDSWPGSRHGHAVASNTDARMWLFGGYGYAGTVGDAGFLADLWSWEPEGPVFRWSWHGGPNTTAHRGSITSLSEQGEYSPSNWPSARYKNTIWTDSNGTIWNFGGRGYGVVGDSAVGYLNDLWSYHSGEWAWRGGHNATNKAGEYSEEGHYSAANWPGARAVTSTWSNVQQGVQGATWIFGGLGYGSSVAPIVGTVNALEGYAYSLDNTHRFEFHHCMAPKLSVTVRPTDYDEADEFLVIYLNGDELGFCDPGMTAQCGEQYECIVSQDISPYINGEITTLDVQLVNTFSVTLATENAACDGEGRTGSYLLAAEIRLDGCGVMPASGRLNDLWAFDGDEWKWYSPDNNTDAVGVFEDRGELSRASWPGSRSEHAAWVDGEQNVWIFGGQGFGDREFHDHLPDMWMFDGSNASNPMWMWVGSENGTQVYDNGTWVDEYSQPGVYGNQGIATPDTWPGARRATIFWVDDEGKRYIQGGHGYGECLRHENGTCLSTGAPGYVSDVWMFSSWCNRGLRIEHSPTICSGTTSRICNYNCDDGYYAVGTHRCEENRTFVGGLCVASVCNASEVDPVSQFVVEGCDADMLQGTVCILGCRDGFQASGFSPGMCINDFNASTALYTDQAVTCTASLCSMPVLTLGQVIVSGCEAGGSMNVSECVLGCEWAPAASATTGLCTADPGNESASYKGFGADCTVKDPTVVNNSRVWTWEDGTLMAGNARALDGPGPITPREAQAMTLYDNALVIFGGLGFGEQRSVAGHLNDLWVYNDSTWTRAGGASGINAHLIYGIDGEADWPGSRTDHRLWVDSGCVWMFGGFGFEDNGQSGYLNDLWKLQSTETWTRMGGSYDPNAVGIYENSSNGPAWPGARRAYATWSPTGCVMLFGGEGYAASTTSRAGYLNDLWSLCYTSADIVLHVEWSWVGGSNYTGDIGVYDAVHGNWPGSRVSSAALVDPAGTSAWMFGGYGFAGSNLAGYLSDLWVHDGTLWTLRSERAHHGLDNVAVYDSLGVSTSWALPGARQGHALWADSKSNLWIFAGFGFGNSSRCGPLNDVWEYNQSSSNWTWWGGSTRPGAPGYQGSQGTATAGTWTGSRHSPSALYDRGRVWMYGGHGTAGYDTGHGQLSDLWTFAEWCTDGLAIDNSNTSCSGAVGHVCVFSCNSGYSIGETHTCRADLSFEGGSCIPSVCPVPALTEGQVIVSGCEVNGAMESNACELGCADGYSASNLSAGICRAVPGSTAAGYQGQEAACLASMCNAPSHLGPEQKVESGCDDYAAMGTHCELGCQRGYIASDGAMGYCTADSGSSTATYVDQSVTCMPFSVDQAIGAWTWIGGAQSMRDQINSSFGIQGVAGSVGWPAPRARHGSCANGYGNGSMWLFGGATTGGSLSLGAASLNDLWAFNGQEWAWVGGGEDVNVPTVNSLQQGSPADTAWPGARSGHSMWDDLSNGFFMFGGHGYPHENYTTEALRLNDLWRYSDGAWILLGGENATEQSGNHACEPDCKWPGKRQPATLSTLLHSFCLYVSILCVYILP